MAVTRRGWVAGRDSGLCAVNDETELVVVDSHEHDRAVLPGGGGGPQPQDFVEEDHRHEAASQSDHIGPGETLDPWATIGPQRYQFTDGSLRQGKPLRGGSHHECRDDGQCERHADPNSRAEARAAAEVDGATDRLDVRFDDVHADPAARSASLEARFSNCLSNCSQVQTGSGAPGADWR
jgi:hypothetical protein